jgi:hypothetical protein
LKSRHRAGRARGLFVALLVVCAALVAVPSAFAGVTVSSFSLTPSNLQAGGSPNYALNVSFKYPFLTGAGDTVKDLTVGLAPGMLATPQNVPNCTPSQLSSNACPSSTEIASGSASATAVGLLPLTLPVAMYQMAPQSPTEFTHFGLVINGIILQLSAQLGAGLRVQPNIGVNLSAGNLPNKVAGFASVQITNLKLTINGTVGGKAYTRMPTVCSAVSSFINADSYSAPTSVSSATSSFTPTGCTSGSTPLKFAPKTTGNVAPDTSDGGSVVTLTTTQAATESASKVWSFTIPNNVTPNLAVLNAADASSCSQANAFAAPVGCPQVGTVAITTSLVAQPITGEIYLVRSTAGALPTLAITLDTPANNVVIDGTIGLGANGTIKATISTLPDLPLTSVVNTFTGGPNALLLTSPQIGCAGTVGGSYTAQDGATATSSSALTVSGTVPACPNPTFPLGSKGSSTKSSFGQTFQLSPSTAAAATTSAVSNPNLTANYTFTYPNSTDSVKDETVALGPGLLATPAGPTGTCTPAQLRSNTCPAASRVGQGTVSVNTTTTNSSISGAQQLLATQYLMAAQSPSEYGRVGMIVTLGGTSVLTLQSPVTLSASGQLTLQFTGIPKSVSILPNNPIAVADQITGESLTFNGTADGNAFLFAPNQCVSTTTSATSDSSAGSNASTATSSYTPTGCPANADASNGGSVGAGGPLADGTASTFGLIPSDATIGANPDMTSILTFTYKDSNAAVGGEAHCAALLQASATATCDALKSVSVALAPGELANAETIPAAQQCTASELSSNTCPATSEIGFGSTSASTYDTNQDGNYGTQNGLQTSVFVMPSSSASDLAELGLIVYFHGNPVATVSGNAQINQSGQILLTFNNLPTEAAIGTGSTVEVYTQVSKIALTFFGTTNQDGAIGTALPFITSPSGCAEEYSTATSTTYQDSTPVTATSAYVPTSSTPGTPAGC